MAIAAIFGLALIVMMIANAFEPLGRCIAHHKAAKANAEFDRKRRDHGDYVETHIRSKP